MKIAHASFIEHICNRLSPTRKTDAFILMVGGRRSGKSWGSVTLAEEIGKRTGKPYLVDKHNFFTTDAFLEEINKGTLEEGQPITLQELGVNASRRNWFKETQKAYNAITQTMGIYRLCVIGTLPSLKLIDPHQTLLAHYVLESAGEINYTKKVSAFIPHVISHNAMSGQTFFPAFRYYEEGQTVPTILSRVYLKPPQQAELYDQLDREYKLRLTRFEQIEMRRNIDSLSDAAELVTKHHDNVITVRRDGRTIYSLNKLEGIGLTSTMAKRVKFYFEKVVKNVGKQ